MLLFCSSVVDVPFVPQTKLTVGMLAPFNSVLSQLMLMSELIDSPLEMSNM